MEKQELVEVRLQGAGTRASLTALRKAIEAITDENPKFGKRVHANGIPWILDASPGWMRLPPDDAERVMERLRADGHEPVSRPLPPPPTAAERSAARSTYLRRAVGQEPA